MLKNSSLRVWCCVDQLKWFSVFFLAITWYDEIFPVISYLYQKAVMNKLFGGQVVFVFI